MKQNFRYVFLKFFQELSTTNNAKSLYQNKTEEIKIFSDVNERNKKATQVCKINGFGGELYYSSEESIFWIVVSVFSFATNLFMFLCICKKRGRKGTHEYYLMVLYTSNLLACCTSQAFLAEAVRHGLKACTTQNIAAMFGASGMNINLLSIAAITYDGMKRIFTGRLITLERKPWLWIVLIPLASVSYTAFTIFVFSLLILLIFTALTVGFYLASIRKLYKIRNNSVQGEFMMVRSIPSHKRAL